MKYPIEYGQHRRDENLTDYLDPKFRFDGQGSFVLPLPGYSTMKLSTTPGSKIIAQSTTDEKGQGASAPESLRSGSLSDSTTIRIGDKLYLDGVNGRIVAGDLEGNGMQLLMDDQYLAGFDAGGNRIFGFYMEDTGSDGAGDFVIGNPDGGNGLRWDNSEKTLIIKGSTLFGGTLQSTNYVPDTSGWMIDFDTGSAEFQDVKIRGRVIMDSGTINGAVVTSTGQTISSIGAHVLATGNPHDSDVSDLEDAQAYITRLQLGLDPVGTYIGYIWTQKLVATTPAVGGIVIDGGGIRGYNAANEMTFRLDSMDGDFYFGDTSDPEDLTKKFLSFDAGTGALALNGELYAQAGNLGGWIMDADRLYKRKPDTPSGAHIKMEINSRTGTGVFPHFQAAYHHSLGESLSDPYDAITMTAGDNVADMNPRIEIIKFNTSTGLNVKRIQLDRDGLHFYDAAGGITHTIDGSASGTTSLGGSVRLNANGIVVDVTKAFSAADGTGRYFQMSCVADGSGLISYPSNDKVYFKSDTLQYQFALLGPKIIGGITGISAVGEMDMGNTLIRTANFNTLQSNLIKTNGALSLPGTFYYNTQEDKMMLYRSVGGWAEWTGGGSSLPTGNPYEMLVCLGGTTWMATNQLHVGGSSTAYFYASDSNTRINSSREFSVNGSIFASGNIYAQGTPGNGILFCNSVHTNDIQGVGLSVYSTGNLLMSSNGGSTSIRSSTYMEIFAQAGTFTFSNADANYGITYYVGGVNILNVGRYACSFSQLIVAPVITVTSYMDVPRIQYINGGVPTYIYLDQPGRIQVSDDFDPTGAGLYNLGGVDRYWNGVYANHFYKKNAGSGFTEIFP